MSTVGNINAPFSIVLTPPAPAESAASDVSTNENLLPAPMQHLATSGDLTAQIAALILQIGHEQQRSARSTRKAAEVAQTAAEEREIRALEDKADYKLAAGLVKGVSQMSSGIGQMQGTNMSQGLAKYYEGHFTAQSAMLEHTSDMAEVAAKRASNAASREKSAVEDARAMVDDAGKSIDKAIELYKEYLTAKNDAAKAAFLRA